MKEKSYPILAENLQVCLRGREIIPNLELKIAQGKLYSIIGPNGSGKTTLLRTIAGTLCPKQGEILINNFSLAKMKDKELAKKMAYVSQNTNVEFDFRIMDYVLMGRYPYLGLLESEGKIDLEYARRAMEITNTWHLREKNINEVSGGERQRVIVARALTQDTAIILLDEPISQLDIHHQLEIMDTLREMVEQRGTTVVAVLHDLNMAAQYSDYLLLIDQGKIAKQGSPAEVLNREVVERVYGLKVQVAQNPETGRPYIIPARGKKSPNLATQTRAIV